MAQVDRDPLTGTETTGHEWDGIRELNTPLPKWWVYVFYVCIIWSIGYYVVYPSWPTLNDYAKGMWGYSARAQLDKELAAVKQARAGWTSKFEQASVQDIRNDKTLLQYAMAGGKVIFADNCQPCHGSAGQGAPTFPVLADDDWLWGGTLEAIEQTVRFGVRSGHADGRDNAMPAFGKDQLLTKDQIAKVTDFVLSLSGQGAANAEGKTVYADQCAACHGDNGKGLQEMGGPNLADGIWLYKGGKDGVTAQLNNPQHGVMPAWTGRLDDVAIKQVTVYVHSLGGGK